MLMPYADAKVYYDGSHYIAIPLTKRPNMKYREQTIEEQITVIQEMEGSETHKVEEPFINCVTNEDIIVEECAINVENEPKIDTNTVKNEIIITKKQLFDKLYMEHIDLPKKERAYKIMEEMLPYFDSVEELKWYVDLGFERKQRNLTARRVRMVRKANLAGFNYFVTFTYDDKKHTELTFKKQLKNKLSLLAYRQKWKYMGVWERSPEKQRLHFHGLFNIPENTLLGQLEIVRDYSKPNKAMQNSQQCTYFTERFGRNDFKELNPQLLGESIAYLFKYLEKTGERIVYSKGMYQFFISDIMEEDIVSTIGQEDKKLLLFDDFSCWNEGQYVGKVTQDIISQLKKCN